MAGCWGGVSRVSHDAMASGILETGVFTFVSYSMRYCLLFGCFFFEHYLYYSTTWVLAFALCISFG